MYSRDDPIRLPWGNLDRMTPLVQRRRNVEDMQHRRDDDEQPRLSEVSTRTYPARRIRTLFGHINHAQAQRTFSQNQMRTPKGREQTRPAYRHE